MGSYSTLVHDEDKAPTYFRHSVFWNLDHDNLPTTVSSQQLRWATPRRWRNNPTNEHPELSEYEIQQRECYSEELWSDWVPIEGIGCGFLSIDDNRLIDRGESGALLRGNEITAASVSGVERLPLCWHKQWRIRAIYYDPPEHSTWDYADADRRVEPHAPFTPTLERLDQSLIKTGDNSYRLTFA